jgi:hypothetical protein
VTEIPTDRETSTAGSAPRVSVSQIADLLAWARRLAEQPFDADPQEQAAFQQAKTDLLAGINDNPALDPHHTHGGGV